MSVKRQRRCQLVLAFFIPIAIIAGAFLVLGIAPFGSRNLLMSDIGTQYIPFLTYFRRMILSGHWTLYSTNLALGDSTIPITAYYLISPFNVLTLFFPAAMMPVAAILIIWLKIGLAGATMVLYLQRVYHKISSAQLLFGTMYALSGYVATYCFDLMWLDAIYLLPLICLGCYRLVHYGKWRFYTVTLALAIMTNYYLGYMTCVFMVLRFIYDFCLAKGPAITWRLWLKTQRRKIGLFISASLLSGLLSAAVLVPTLVGMLKTSKQQMSLQNFLPYPKFGLEGLVQLGVVGNDWSQTISHGPSLYISLLGLLLLCGFFLMPSINRRRRLLAGALLVAIVLGLWLTPLNTIWHMLQAPKGFPYRNAFFFSFVGITLAYETFQTSEIFQKQYLRRALALAGSLLIVGYGTAIWLYPKLGQLILAHQAHAKIAPALVAPIYLGFSLLWLLLAACSLLWCRHTRYRWLIGVLLALELGFNLVGVMKVAPFGNQTVYQRNYRIEQRWYQKAAQKRQDFFRIDNENSLINAAYPVKYNNYNDPLLFGFNSLNLYSSTLNEQQRVFLDRLGFYSKNSRRIASIGSTQVTNALFAVHYDMSLRTTDYDLVANRTALPVGFMASKQALHVPLTLGDPLTNQNRIWQRLTGTTEQYFQPITLLKQQVTHQHRRYQYQLQVQATTTGRLYGYFGKARVTGLQIQGRSEQHLAQWRATSKLIKVQQGQRLTITFTSKRHIAHWQRRLQVLDQAAFAKSAKVLQQQPLHLTKGWQGQHLKGDVTVTAPHQLLVASMPYDIGWQAKVDGKHVAVRKVSGNLIGVPLTNGPHHVELYYRTPKLITGVVLSLIGVLGLFGRYRWPALGRLTQRLIRH
jgi:uncharacterized membrane protein YfhO